MTMNRIVWHHTGGPYDPTPLDLAAYHRLVTGDALVVAGNHPIEANAPGRALIAGRYAAHTARLNTGAIGLAVCAMGGASWSKPAETRFFPRPRQIDALVAETANLCRVYGIDPTREHVLSHAEVEVTLGVRQAGKWDFDYAVRAGSGVSGRDPVAIGDELRAEVRALLGTLAPRPIPNVPRPVLRRGAKGAAVRELQEALNRRGARLIVDGDFGPGTFEAVWDFQCLVELRPDGVVGPMTWAALGLKS